jgi:drug/metabolite transporter (DMT)-like permease
VREDLKGTIAALGAAALFGASAPLAKLLLANVRPLPLSALLYLGAGVGLVALPHARTALRTRATETPLRRADVGLLITLTIFGGVLGPVLLLTGLSRTSGLIGSLALNLEAPLTILIAVTLFGEHIGARETVAAAVIVAGVVLLSAHRGEGVSHPIGVAAIAGACLCWAVDNNVSQRLSLRDPIAIARVKALSAGTVSLVLALLAKETFPREALAPALLIGFVSYGLSFVLAVHAMRLLGAAREAALFAVAPFAGALASVAILGDRLVPRDLVATFILIAGVVALMRAEHAHMHDHPELEHEHGHVHDEHHQHRHAPGQPTGEPHAHAHRHDALTHAHGHRSDVHHRHGH